LRPSHLRIPHPASRFSFQPSNFRCHEHDLASDIDH
jgi:hypothetical protein